jgi:hypothetical protein
MAGGIYVPSTLNRYISEWPEEIALRNYIYYSQNVVEVCLVRGLYIYIYIYINVVQVILYQTVGTKSVIFNKKVLKILYHCKCNVIIILNFLGCPIYLGSVRSVLGKGL